MSFQVEIDKAIKDQWIYFVGESLPTDWYAGFKLWKRLADEGDVKAQVNVGKCYVAGMGVDKSNELAHPDRAWQPNAERLHQVH